MIAAVLAVALQTPRLPLAACRDRREIFDDDDRQAEAIAICHRCAELPPCRAYVSSTAVPPGGVVAGVWREHPLLADDDPVGLTGRLLALAVEPIDRDTTARLLGITEQYAAVVLSRLAGAGRLEVVDARPKRYRAIAG
jgi:hypothetical protein